MDTPAVPLLSWMQGPSEQIAKKFKDNMHCEEQLRTTLHCDDKEKLRRKLALLQREYLRTAERLQRAERLDAVRRHVGSKISQQDHQDQRDPQVTSNPCPCPSSLMLNTPKGTAPSIAQCQRHTGGLADSDAACPQTPDPSHDTAKGYRSSPALRLRSQRSRLRWERSAGRSTDDSREEGLSQSERMETVRTEGSEERVKIEGTEVVNESEELFSCTDSESPSLLLTHWNSSGQTETGDNAGKDIQGRQKQREKESELKAEGKIESESTSLLLTGGHPAIHAEGMEPDVTQNGRKEETEEGEENRNTKGQRDVRLCEESSNKDTDKNAAEEIVNEKSHDNTAEINEEKRELIEGEHDVKGVGLLDSCTLVEGLLFPAEYYVRTTRRMTSSQSQPDMRAVILSQLSTGRQRRGRGLNRCTHNPEQSGQHTGTSLSSLATVPVDPRMESQSADTSTELNSQSSSEILDQISASCHQVGIDARLSPTAITARPARGRRKRRGRGRGRPQTPRCSIDTHRLSLGETSHNPQPTSSPLSSSPSLHGADGPTPHLTLGEAVPIQDDPPSVSILSSATQPCSGDDGAQVSSAFGHLVKFFPIFLKNGDATNGSTQMSRSPASLQSLLLPSSSSPAQTSLFPLPCLSPHPLVNKLMNFDITQDFHLPDDQFASLKLHKLRQVAVDSGVEYFTSPYHHSRRSNRRSDTQSSSDTMMPLPLSLSLTPTMTNSPHPPEPKQAATQSVDFQNLSIDHKLEDKLTSQSLTEGSAKQDMEIPAEQHTEILYPECLTRITSTESVSVVQDCAADFVDRCVEQDAVILNTHSQRSVSASDTHRPADHPVKPPPHVNFADKPAVKVNDYVIRRSDELQIKESFVISSEEQTVCSGVVHPLEDQRLTNHQTEDKATIKTLSLDCPIQETLEDPPNCCTAVQFCKNSEAQGASPVQHLNAANDSNETTTSSPRDRLVGDKNPDSKRVHSQLLLSPLLASEPCPFITPHLPSSAPANSPTMPSLGLTPHPHLTSSPTAAPLTLAPRLSPSTQVLSPSALCPCPSLLFSQPTTFPAGQIQASSVTLRTDDQRVDPPVTVSSNQPQGSSGQVGVRIEGTAEEHTMRCTHTLKAPAGSCLVDAYCLPGSSGHLCVVAAGKWAVCLWSQTSASDWSLTHTWAFNEPVINVFPVPDAAGLICVTLGQLEIREVRMLSCSSLLQVLLCEGVVQTVAGVSKSRVVTSSHSASGSTLQVFTLSDSGSTWNSQTLMCPGVCVGALARVDGLSEALIGTDEGGNLFVWNVKTGQQLRRIILGDGLSHTSCLRGYSYCGVLFVLLQHQLLSSLEEDTKEERKTSALLSLVAVNPLTGKSVLATQLHPPKAWSGRLCDADVYSSRVVGLSQSGCVCVWDLGQRATSRMVWSPGSEGWELARWGGGGTLVTGHHNGDVTLHCSSTSQASLCHGH